AAVPFRNRARLVQLGSARAKLPSSLVEIKPKQLVGGSMHLLCIASGFDGRGDLEGIFDEVFASAFRLAGAGALAAALFFAVSTPPSHKAAEWAPASQFLQRI